MNIAMTRGSGFVENEVARELMTQGFQGTLISRPPSHMPNLKEITTTEARQRSQLDAPTGDVFFNFTPLPETTGKQTGAEALDTNVEQPLDCLKLALEVAKFQLYTLHNCFLLSLIAACSNTASCKVIHNA